MPRQCLGLWATMQRPIQRAQRGKQAKGYLVVWSVRSFPDRGCSRNETLRFGQLFALEGDVREGGDGRKEVVVLQAECLLAQPQVALVECFGLVDAALVFRYLCQRRDSVGDLDMVGTERGLESGQRPSEERRRLVGSLKLLQRTGGRYHRLRG